MVAGFPACVTLMVLLELPYFRVTEADREDVLVLASALIVTDLVPVPEVGETVNHDWLLVAVHEVLLVIVTDSLPPASVKLSDDLETDSERSSPA